MSAEETADLVTAYALVAFVTNRRSIHRNAQVGLSDRG
jgi:hypothetical protein